MIIRDFPIGPSVNNYLRPLRSTGQFVKTVDGQIYDKKVLIWKLKNNRLCDEIKSIFTGHNLRLDFYLVFNKKKFFGKKNQRKKKDYKNHIKIIEDAFCKCIDIDDRFVKSGHTELVFCDDDEKEKAILSIMIDNNFLTELEVFKILNHE